MHDEQISLAELARHIAFEKKVALLAYQFYEEEGRPEGRALEHWRRAEDQIRQHIRSLDLASENSTE